MKKRNASGGKSDKPSTASDVKLFEMAFDASEKPRGIHITFADDSGSCYGISRISLPHVKGVMTISTPTPLGQKTQDISSASIRPSPDSQIERWNWGEE